MKRKLHFVFDLVCITLLVAFGLVIAWPRWRAGIDWGDEGFLAYGAVRVMQGDVPHRDFVSLQPPLSFYSVALVFRMFGTSLLSLREFGLTLFLLLPVLIYAITRSLTKPFLALVAALPACVLGLPLFYFVPFAVWQGITATLIAGFLYLRAVEHGRVAPAIGAAVLTTASLLCRHDQAIYFMVAVAVFTGVLRLSSEESRPQKIGRIFGCWSGTVLTIMVALLIYWWARGAAVAMWKQLVVFPATVYGKTSALAFPHFSGGAPVPEKAATLLFYLPPSIAAIAVLWLVQRVARGRFSRREAVMVFLIVWSILFYCQALTRSDLNHLFITLPPFFILSAYCWRALLDALGDRGATRILVSVPGLAAIAVFVWLLRPLALPDQAKANETLALPTGGIRVENGQWLSDFVIGVQRYVPADRPILALPYQPMFYFLCQRRNPTRWNYIWPGDQTAKEHRQLIGEAEHDPPAVIFLTGENEMGGYAPEILEYVHGKYRRAVEFGRLAVYFPNGSTP